MKTDERLSKIQSGKDLKVYDYLGCHLASNNGKSGAYFRVYAPNAKAIYVVGDFNDWDRTTHPLKRIKNSSIWECFVEKAKNLQRYKYIVVDPFDKENVNSDPYAFYGENMEYANDFASIIYDISGLNWKDSK